MGRMPIAFEVTAFEGEVGGDEEVVAAGRREDCAVIANAELEGSIRVGAGARADEVDEGELAAGRVGFGCHAVKDTVERRTD